MPITTKEPKADVPFAKSPEFQKLQDAISQAKEALDDVSRQIVAIESKLNPTAPPAGQAVQPATQNSGSMYNYQGVPGLDVQESIKYNELERIVTLTGR